MIECEKICVIKSSQRYNNMMNRLLLFLLSLSFALCSVAKEYTYKGGRDSNTGLTRVGLNGKFGYIDDAGKEVVPVIYEELGDFGDGNRPAVAKLRGMYGYIDANGKQVTDFVYHEAFSFDWDSRLAPVCKKKYNGDFVFGYIDLHGKEVIPLKYEVAMPFSDGLAAVRENDVYIFIDEQGNMVVPGKYKDVEWGFFDGFAWVANNYGKWGMIDHRGNVKTAFIYDKLSDFDYYSGDADAYKNGVAYYYDKSGKSYSSKSQRDLAKSKNNLDIATIDWINTSFSTTEPKFTIKARVKSKSKISNVTISVEGLRGIKTIKSDGCEMQLNQEVALSEGPNKVTITAMNEAGFSKSERTIIYRKKAIPQIEWSTAEQIVSEQTYQLVANIRSESKISDVYILINDERNKTTRNIITVKNDNYNMTLKQPITLSEGVNSIRIVAQNEAGRSMSDTKKVLYEIKKEPIKRSNRRLALIIGNANYSSKENCLKNPVNDANDFASKLEELGFDVIRSLDKTHEGMEMDIAQFGEKAKNYDVALFFYAGHGVQSDKINYLIPTDAKLNGEAEIKYKCIPVDLVIETMAISRCPMKIVILDACRDNQWERSWRRSYGYRGFTGVDTPSGIFIAYSTASGQPALDGDGRNSPYMSAILKTLTIPGLSLSDFFHEVSASVLEKTNNQQAPWTQEGAMGREKFYFNLKTN